MAIIILDKTKCLVCNETLDGQRPFVSLPAFVVNENDSLAAFNDSACHDDCFMSHELKDQVLKRIGEWKINTGPGNRVCIVCKEEVLDPDDYIMIDYLTSDCSSPTFKYNYTHLHKSHINEWGELTDFLMQIKQLSNSVEWGGSYLKYLEDEMNKESNKE